MTDISRWKLKIYFLSQVTLLFYNFLTFDILKSVLKGFLPKFFAQYILEFYHRAVASSENTGGHVVLGGDNVPPG